METPVQTKELTVEEILAQNDAMLAESAKVNQMMDRMQENMNKSLNIYK